MISETHINRLAGALSLDSQLRTTFLLSPLAAIEEYNLGNARRFGQKPIELNDEERSLVSSLETDSIEKVYELLDNALEAQATYSPQLPLKNSTYFDSAGLLRAGNSAA